MNKQRVFLLTGNDIDLIIEGFSQWLNKENKHMSVTEIQRVLVLIRKFKEGVNVK